MTQTSVVAIANGILAREGSYVDDPDDPGGATNHGVTIGTMRRLGLDLDGDGDVDKDDVRRLTVDQARQIFLDHYFYGPGINRLPECLHATVFDMQVNAGSRAIRILQYLLNDRGHDLSVDGVIGPQTIKAAYREADAAGERNLADAYGIARRDYYYALADRRPASRKYARRRDGGKGGWIVRAEEFISPIYRLTDAQHHERTARWGAS